MIRLLKRITSLKIWNVSCPRNTSWRLLFMLSLDKTKSRRTISESLKTSSKWLVPPHPSATLFQEDSAWPNVSSSLSNSTMYLSTLSLFDHILLMMTTSSGTLELLQHLPKSIRTLRNLFFRSKILRWKTITVIFHGCADAILWTSSHTWHGRSTSTWRPQMNPWASLTWLPMTVTRWVSSTTQSKLSTFLRDSTQIPNSGKVREVQPLEYFRWL